MVAKGDKADLKRRRIIEAGTVLFSRFGVKKTTLMDLGRRARLGKATLYYYFPSGKNAIFSAVVRSVVDRIFNGLVAQTEAAGTPRAALEAYIRARIAVFDREVTVHGLEPSVWDELMHRAQTELREYFEKERELLESLVRDGIEAKDFREADAQVVARVIQAALKGLTADRNGSPVPVERAREVDQLVTLIFRGLANA